jgi:N-acetylneuraminic acid mutarotase
MAVAGSRLYIYGGYAGALLSDLWQYDTSTGVWTELAASSLPGGRAGHGICAVGGKLYLFGGQTDSGAGADLWEYDILTGSWTELYTTASSPIVYRIDFAYAAIGQYIYIYGGYYNTNMPLADMWEYDTVADAWREVGTGFPAYDCANQSVAFNNALYAFGGLGSSNVATLDTATEFT